MNLSEQIYIKPVHGHEVEVLRELALKTFLDSFAALNTKEDMDAYVNEHLSIDHLQKELNNPQSEFYFAIFKEKPIGYIKLNFHQAQSDINDPDAMEIERIYVEQAFQGMQVGQWFCDFAIEKAKSRALNYIWLGVWEKNQGAIRFYERIGFKKFSTHTFMLGSDKQTDILIKLIIER